MMRDVGMTMGIEPGQTVTFAEAPQRARSIPTGVTLSGEHDGVWMVGMMVGVYSQMTQGSEIPAFVLGEALHGAAFEAAEVGEVVAIVLRNDASERRIVRVEWDWQELK